MGDYQMDMSDEKEPQRRKLLDEGERTFKVVSCEPSVSKSGNDMFIIELEDKETGYIDKVYLVSVPKKRWLLKQLLSACGIPAGQDGVYDWSVSDIIDKEVVGEVEHEDNTWINRDGEEITTKQHKIVSYREASWDGE